MEMFNTKRVKELEEKCNSYEGYISRLLDYRVCPFGINRRMSDEKLADLVDSTLRLNALDLSIASSDTEKDNSFLVDVGRAMQIDSKSMSTPDNINDLQCLFIIELQKLIEDNAKLKLQLPAEHVTFRISDEISYPSKDDGRPVTTSSILPHIPKVYICVIATFDGFQEKYFEEYSNLAIEFLEEKLIGGYKAGIERFARKVNDTFEFHCYVTEGA